MDNDRFMRVVTGVLVPRLVRPALAYALEVTISTLGTLDVSSGEATHIFWAGIEALARDEQASNGTMH